MHWEPEAEEIVESTPLPPVMSHLARMDAERRALQQGLGTVTTAVAEATAKGYRKVLGEEATEAVSAMLRGEQIDLPDAFFTEDEGELFKIDICPAKYGACTRQKRSMIEAAITAARTTLKRIDTTAIILKRARTPLMSHHILRIAVIGCPNCCLSPYFADFGIIARYQPAVTADGCTQCKKCLKSCLEHAVSLQGTSPVIDFAACIGCGECERACPAGVISSTSCYKVVAGGTGARHPRIARTLTECADLRQVANILENTLTGYRDAEDGGRELSFHEFVQNNA